MHNNVYKMFPVRIAFQHEEEWAACAQIINSVVPGVDKKDRGSGTSRFTSLTKLMIKRFETEESIWVERHCNAQDVWIRCCFAFILDLETGRKYQTKSPKCGACYVLTGMDCKVLCGFWNVAATKSFSLEFYFIVKVPRLVNVYVCKDSSNYVSYTIKNKKQKPSVLKLKAFDLPPLSVFIVHTYLQHAAREYLSDNNILYHVNLMLATTPTLDAMCNSYGDSLAISTIFVAADN